MKLGPKVLTSSPAAAALLAGSCLAMLAFLYFFVVHNTPGWESPPLMATIAAVYGLLFLAASWVAARANWRKFPPCDHASVLVGRIVMLAATGLLLWAFLDAAVLDYYQPLSLFDDAIAALAVSWGLLCLCLLWFILRAPKVSLEAVRGALLVALVALAGWGLAAALPWLTNPQPGEQVQLHRDVFVGGEDGYAIYRIPALLVLPAGSELANGDSLSQDRLLAFAEARRDGALDTGVIDLVMKTSEDGGASWSQQQVVCRHETDGKRGKCGNATPLFDAVNGTVWLPYNLSSVPGTEGGARHHQSVIKSSPDGGVSWSQPLQLADDNLVFGPGHGIEKKHAPHSGRLLIPGYVNEKAIALYSDDAGASWQRSTPLDTGDETEIAELSDGRLYLTTRHRAPIGRPPQPNGRLYSHSEDGGATWSETERDTRLITPICQASVHSHSASGGLLFSNPAHPKARVQLRLRYSPDDGANWPVDLMVYPGPAGYSELGDASNGDVFVLYERGAMSYSEKISLARIGSEALSL